MTSDSALRTALIVARALGDEAVATIDVEYRGRPLAVCFRPAFLVRGLVLGDRSEHDLRAWGEGLLVSVVDGASRHDVARDGLAALQLAKEHDFGELIGRAGGRWIEAWMLANPGRVRRAAREVARRTVAASG